MKAHRAGMLIIAVLAAAALVSACGGGGGGNTNLPPITYSITGIVSGAPAGTTVTLTGAANATTTTNSIGYYQFSGLSNGSYTVTPSNAGYLFSPASKPVTISSGNAVNTDFTVTNAFNITGTVSGAPQGVTITLSGDAIATATTNSIGYYQFTGLSNGAYTVTPSMPGYTLYPASHSVTISSANAGNTNFAVVFGIPGTVMSGGAGLSGVTITLVNSSGSSTTRTTDINGNYSAFGLDAGTYTISAAKANYAMNPLNQKATTACEVTTGIDFTATTAATTYSILGTVTTDTGGFPDVTVTLSGANTGFVFTGADGTYAISGLLDGAYTVTPSKRTGTTTYKFTPTSSPTITISGADSTGNNFAHTSTMFGSLPVCLQSTLSGIVSGASVSGVTMNVLVTPSTAASTTTDSGGFFSLKTMASGTFSLSPSQIGYSFTPPRICGSVTCAVGATISGNNFISQ